jgi:PleD family two-component response regulator
MVPDIPGMKPVQAQLVRMTRVDDLTGLPNPNQLYEWLAEVLMRARRGVLQVGLSGHR